MINDEEKKLVLNELNSICPDTFNEGPNGDWTFTDLSNDGNQWNVHFSNDSGADSVSFQYDGSCIEDNMMNQDWFDNLNDAIYEWEMDNTDDF